MEIVTFFDFLTRFYLTIKACHIISFVCWMAGLFYLPRLFYYHSLHLHSMEISGLFQKMERRLLKIIMNPAQIATYVFGFLLALTPGILSSPVGWFHAKILCVLSLSAFHGFLSYTRKQLALHISPCKPKTYALLNEIPTVLLILIVFFVLYKAF